MNSLEPTIPLLFKIARQEHQGLPKVDSEGDYGMVVLIFELLLGLPGLL